MIENVLGLRKRSTFHIIHHTTTFESASMKETETNLSREREECVFYMNTCWLRRGLTECHTTFSDGCLGSLIDEERSEMRYVMRIAESSESSKL